MMLPGRRPRADRGFTLIELLVVMSIAGTLALISTFSFSNWRNTSQHQGSADELVSQLRNTSQRSISEGRTYCVDVASGGRSYTLWRTACGATGTQVAGPFTVQGPNVTLTAAVTPPTPAPVCPATSTCLYFYPRGTAVPAVVTVASAVRSKTYTVRVEGLTARVYT